MKSLNLTKATTMTSLPKILYPPQTNLYPVLPWASINLLSVHMKNPPNVDLQCPHLCPFPPPYPRTLVFQAPLTVYLLLSIHQLFHFLHILTLSWINSHPLLHIIHPQFSVSRQQPRPTWQLPLPMTGSRLLHQSSHLQDRQWITQPWQQPPVK